MRDHQDHPGLPAHTGELRNLSVENGFWDWAKEWSRTSVVQEAVPDPAELHEARSEGSIAPLEEPEPSPRDVDSPRTLCLQNVGSDSEVDVSPKALTM